VIKVSFFFKLVDYLSSSNEKDVINDAG